MVKIEKTKNIEHIRDGLLYFLTMMIVITIFANLKFGLYFADSQKVYLDYAIFGIAICITHLISDKICLKITTDKVVKAMEKKEKISKAVVLIPYFGELLSDFICIYTFALISKNVMFGSYLIPAFIVVLMRLLNGLIDPIMGLLFRKEGLIDGK